MVEIFNKTTKRITKNRKDNPPPGHLYQKLSTEGKVMFDIVIKNDKKQIVLEVDGLGFTFLYEVEQKSYNIKNTDLTYFHYYRPELIYKPQSFNSVLYEEFAEIVDYVKDNIYSTPPLSDICDLFLMSSDKIERMFKKHIHMPYYRYMQMLRIGFAISKLSNPCNSVYAIAEELGFSSSQNFIKFFRKYTGMKPSCARAYLIAALSNLLYG